MTDGTNCRLASACTEVDSNSPVTNFVDNSSLTTVTWYGHFLKMQP